MTSKRCLATEDHEVVGGLDLASVLVKDCFSRTPNFKNLTEMLRFLLNDTFLSDDLLNDTSARVNF